MIVSTQNTKWRYYFLQRNDFIKTQGEILQRVVNDMYDKYDLMCVSVECHRYYSLSFMYRNQKTTPPISYLVFEEHKHSVVFNGWIRIWRHDPLISLKLKLIQWLIKRNLNFQQWKIDSPFFTDELLVNMIRLEMKTKYGIETRFEPKKGDRMHSILDYTLPGKKQEDWSLVWFERFLGKPVCVIFKGQGMVLTKIRPGRNFKKNVKKYVDYIVEYGKTHNT